MFYIYILFTIKIYLFLIKHFKQNKFSISFYDGTSSLCRNFRENLWTHLSEGGGINPVILKYFIYIYFRLKSFKKGRSGRPNKREGGGRISVYL